MKKNKKHRKTPKYVEEQYWSTLMVVDDEMIDLLDVWHFNYFVAITILPLLRDFIDVAEIKPSVRRNTKFFETPPPKCVSKSQFEKMVSSLSLMAKYFNEGGLIYDGKNINLECGGTITELSDALHLFVNLLPYLNHKHFSMSAERYEDAPDGRHCDFDELCNLDRTIAKRIFPTLQTFASLSISGPEDFRRMYIYAIPDSIGLEMREWRKVLDAMVESWRWILDRPPAETPSGWEEIPEKIYYGLHLFAEYLPEMCSD